MCENIEDNITRQELDLEPLVKVEPILLSEFIGVYQEDRSRIGKSKETFGVDVLALGDLMKFTGDYRLDSINSVLALQYRNHLLENVKTATASIRLRAIRTAFNWAVNKPGEKFLKVNPFSQKGIVPSVHKNKKLLCLTQVEKRKFLGAIDDPNHLLLFQFYILTGCRRSEAINLHWSDIDLENKVIQLRQTKTHKDRSIPITLELMQVIAKFDKSKPKPFNYIPGTASRLFSFCRKKAEVCAKNCICTVYATQPPAI